MIPLLEVQPGVFVNIMHVDHFREVKENSTYETEPAGLYYHLRDHPDEKWIRVHPSLEKSVRDLIPHLTLRVVKAGQPGIVLAKPLN